MFTACQRPQLKFIRANQNKSEMFWPKLHICYWRSTVNEISTLDPSMLLIFSCNLQSKLSQNSCVSIIIITNKHSESNIYALHDNITTTSASTRNSCENNVNNKNIKTDVYHACSSMQSLQCYFIIFYYNVVSCHLSAAFETTVNVIICLKLDFKVYSKLPFEVLVKESHPL